MKQFIFLASIVVLTISVINCGSESGENKISSREKSSLKGSISENDTIQISGILICTHCYSLNEKNTGTDHQLPENGFVKNCAGMCAQQNYPIGVLSGDKQYGANVWVIRTSSQLFSDYMSKEVKIKGLFIKDALIEPSQIEVKDGDKWITLL
ncbi:MAG: hypothetical protein HZB42_08030 [Sphingobacteriales bacterium]|nr:hypothetical protein [Sphingobacteriales bacterium]